MSADVGRRFRKAWIAGVRAHFPSEPKPAYATPWQAMPTWEQEAATVVGTQLAAVIAASPDAAAALPDGERGSLVSVLWNLQMRQRLADPKPSYVAAWADLPEWQQRTDIGIFNAFLESHRSELAG